MGKATYILKDGTHKTVDIPEGTPLALYARAHQIPGILAECGGNMACGTCHGPDLKGSDAEGVRMLVQQLACTLGEPNDHLIQVRMIDAPQSGRLHRQGDGHVGCARTDFH